MMTTLTLCLAEAGDLEDRPRIVAQQVLDLGVADDRQAARALRVRRRRRRAEAGGRDGRGGQQRQRAGRWRPAPGPDRGLVLDHADLCHRMR